MLYPLYITETRDAFFLSFRYEENMVAVIKRVPGVRWSDQNKEWIISKKYPFFPSGRDARWYVDAFENWCRQYKLVSEIRRCVESDVKYKVPRMKEFKGEHYILPPFAPYDYQLDGVRYALDHKRCIFGDQPGLGKTMQAICSVVKAHKEANVYGESFPVLVICPSALKVNWQREFKKFAGLDAVILDNDCQANWHRFWEMKKGDGESIASVFIVNYESIKKYFVKEITSKKRLTLKSIKFDERIKLFNSIIIDESHRCKSSETQQSKFVEGICKGKRWIFALTGTPVVNNNTDLIQQLKILDRLEDFGGRDSFINRYCGGSKQSSNREELKYKLWMNCFFRREKNTS